MVAQTVKCLPTMRETGVQSLGREDPLEKEMATHSSILVWKIPWTVAYQVAKSRTRLSDFTFTFQWLALCTPNVGNLDLIPGQGARYHMPQLRPSTAK